MKYFTSLFLIAVLAAQVYAQPQFITFQDGKLGVNFGGYHAGVGIGGLLGGTGTSGGLYAEAGTPYGQSAKAGLGGSVDEKGGASGGLFAGATAGGNVKASAGLGGGVNAARSAGGGFASAQAGDHFASSGLAGETSEQGSGGILHTSTNDVQPLEVKPISGNVQGDFNIEATNEIKPLEFVPLNSGKSEVQTKVEVKGDIQPPVIVKEVYVEPQPQVVEKHIIHTHYKPRRQHFRKTAYVGGYIGGEGDVAPPVIYKTEPAIQKRIDVGAEASANAGASVGGDVHGTGQVYTKQITYQKNPTLFQDIFNIPIQTLRAVGNLLSNTAANTNISVQKSASVQAETDSESAKHEPSSVSSSSAHISVETPSASKLIDDIFAIPINTLGAVNKFLQNNVPTRKNVQILQEGGEPTQVRLGPHARRRANKQVLIVQEAADKEAETEA
ncbi:uncharacterized protein [Epargyreus clarus]|uniref:uncharacterized protein isoform X2 n=1 Tax=Epargyreus clarus TaxID=520877 RepID=UPI003C30DAF5